MLKQTSIELQQKLYLSMFYLSISFVTFTEELGSICLILNLTLIAILMRHTHIHMPIAIVYLRDEKKKNQQK